MTPGPGSNLAHYRLVEKLGEGGMGEVWRATDTRLGRDVAIKILPQAFAADPERLARFEREAKLSASLNHPSIAGVYGFHDEDELRFLAMELVPGEDLAQRLGRGGVAFAEAVEIATQIADALDAAHEQGIIHRDLKPANIKVTPDGKVKVLDFGLAKALDPLVSSGSARDAAMSPTITSLGTVAGVILGTAAYMSPEAARGKSVDKRADIWAFGCVLFELLSGRRAFDGETVSDTLASVLAREPDWNSLPATTPAKVRDLLQRCLEKDPKRRMRDIGDARLELDEALADRTASGRMRVAEARSPELARRSIPLWAFAAMAACAIVGASAGAIVVSKRAPLVSASGVIRLDLLFPPDVRFSDWDLSRGGSAVTALGIPRVGPGEALPPARAYVRRLDAGIMRVVPGSEGASSAFFSEDANFVYVTAPATVGSAQLNFVRLSADGSSPPLTLTAVDPSWSTGCALNSGDFIFLKNGNELVRVSARGGETRAGSKVDLAGEKGQIAFSTPALPGDNAILLHAIAYGVKGWYYRVGVLDLRTARITFLFDDGGWPAYSAETGTIVFSRGDTLFAVGFDPKTLKLNGSPVPVISNAQTRYSFEPARFLLANDGTLAYVPGGKTAEGRRLGIVDASGNVTSVSDERHPYEYVCGGTTAGRRFVTTITNGQGIDELWTGELDRPGLRRVLAVPGADLITPVLSRDGSMVVFDRRGRTADDGLYVKSLDDEAPPRRFVALPPEDVRTATTSFAPDRSGVIATHLGTDLKNHIVFAALRTTDAPPSELKPVVASTGNETSADLSPDGKWIAYSSDESGRAEIYTASFHPGATVTEVRRVTASGGTGPIFSLDGRQLRYVDASGRVLALPITNAASLSFGPAKPLFDQNKLNLFVSDILPDGRQLAVLRGEEESDEIRRLALGLNFTNVIAEKVKAAR